MIEITPSTLNPFPGLRSFEEEENYLFFGREKQIDELVKKLRTKRFSSVLGASGSGKSSLVKSGLIPALHSGFMSGVGSGWKTTTFKPGNDPIGNMAKALARDIDDNENFNTLSSERIIEKTLRRSNRGVIEVVRQFQLCEVDSLLLVVDQFEELFRFSRLEEQETIEKQDALSFVNLLLEAAQDQDFPIYIVITMRSDFLGDFTQFRGLTEVINEGQYLVPRMSREELKLAITGPIAVGGGTIDQPLLTRLLNDIGDDTDQLPILQHALMRTWDYWLKNKENNEPISLEHYRRIGTMEKALSNHANEAYEELDEEQKRICKAIFSTLTDKEKDNLGIRRPTPLDELTAVANTDEASVKKIIEVFRQPGRSFLICAPELESDTIIDISHESLMRIWDKLIDWLEDETMNAEAFLKITTAAQLYEKNEQSLYNGPQLALALRWWDTFNPTPKWAERYDPSFERARHFLALSKEEEEREGIRKERERKYRKWLTTAFVFFALTSITIIAIQQYQGKRDEVKRSTQLAKDLDETKTNLSEKEKRLEEREIELKENKVKLEERELELTEKEKDLSESQKELNQLRKKLRLYNQQIKGNEAALEKSKEDLANMIKDLNKSKKELAAITANLAITTKGFTDTKNELTARQKELKERIKRMEANVEAGQALVYINSNMLDSARHYALNSFELNKEALGPQPNPIIYDALIKTWNATTQNGENILDYKVQGNHALKNVKWENGKIATMGKDRYMRIWVYKNALVAKANKKTPFLWNKEITAFDFIDASRVMIGTLKGKLYFWDFEKNDFKKKNLGDKSPVHSIINLSTTAESPNLVLVASNNKITLLKGSNYEPEVLSTGSYIKVTAQQSNDKIWLAKASGNELQIVNYSSDGLQENNIDTILLKSTITALAIHHQSTNGKDTLIVAAGLENGDIQFWQFSKNAGSHSWKTSKSSFPGHRLAVTDLKYNRSIRKLASSSLDHTARIWDLSAGKNHLTLPLENNQIHSITFSPENNYVVHVGESGNIKFLPIRMEVLRDLLAKNNL